MLSGAMVMLEVLTALEVELELVEELSDSEAAFLIAASIRCAVSSCR